MMLHNKSRHVSCIVYKSDRYSVFVRGEDQQSELLLARRDDPSLQPRLAPLPPTMLLQIFAHIRRCARGCPPLRSQQIQGVSHLHLLALGCPPIDGRRQLDRFSRSLPPFRDHWETERQAITLVIIKEYV
jgi:hypothetical protein